jgi:tetratricopeptide (TPR) repeat protein
MRLVWSNREDHRRDLSSKTVSVARKVRDPATLAFALCARHATLMGARQFEQRRQVVNEIGRLAKRTRDASLALLHHVFRIRIELENGNLDAASEELARYEHIVDEQGLPHAAWYSDQFRSMQALLRGDFQAVHEHCAKLLRAAENLQEGTALQSYNSIDCLRRRACGKVEEAVTILEGVVRQFPELRSMRCALAQINCEAGQPERGRELYDELVANVHQLPEDEVWGNSVAALCEACCELGDEANAQLLYDLIAPAQDRFFVLHYGMAILSSAARVCGRLATLLGEWETASNHFRDALQREPALGSPPLVARSELDFAKMLQARGRKRDRERAGRLLSSAARTARSLGMAQLEREALESS